MKKLFENIGNNRFRLLLTENIVGEENIRSGLEKVFINATDKISYKKIESFGLAYIKDVSTAQRVALREAKEIAKKHGFRDDENKQQFVREFLRADGTDTSNPPLHQSNVPNVSNVPNDKEEKHEVQIGEKILKYCKLARNSYVNVPNVKADYFTDIENLAKELIKMHRV